MLDRSVAPEIRDALASLLRRVGREDRPRPCSQTGRLSGDRSRVTIRRCRTTRKTTVASRFPIGSVPSESSRSSARGGMGVVYAAEQTEPRPTARRAQGHQARHGLKRGRRPLRGRAPGPRRDGPPGHRQASSTPAPPRRAGRTLSWSSSRASPSPTTATRHGCRRGTARASSKSKSVPPSSTPTRRASSTATSSPRTSWSRARGQTARRVKVIDFGDRQGARAVADRQDAGHEDRPGDRHAGVHEPGAGERRRASTSTRAPTCTRWASCSTSY